MNTERDTLVELIEKIMVKWNYTHSEGRVYAELLLSEKPLTIDELSQRTGLSRSSVSTSLGRLLKDYLVTYTKRGKTKLFRALPSLRLIFLKQPRELLEKEVRPLRQIAERVLDREKMSHVIEDIRRLENILEEIAKFTSRKSNKVKNTK